MKIAIVLHRSIDRISAVEWWRVISPLTATCSTNGWQLDTYYKISDFSLLEKYDLVWFSYMDNILGFKELIDRNIKFVVDFDDDILNIGHFNPVKKEYPPGGIAYRSIQHIIQHAPHISVSTEHLAKVYGKLRKSNNPPAVLENRINKEAYYTGRHKTKDVFNFKIGWMGGSTHYADIFHTPFWGALCYLQGKYPRLAFSAIGLYPDADWKDLPNFSWVDGSSDHTTYTKILNKWIKDINVCVAPLEDNLFNSSKSSIKIQEYGIHGKPVVASSVRPYQEFNSDSGGLVRLADTHKDWVDHLETLIQNRRFRDSEGRALQNYILENYTLESVIDKYSKYIECVVNGIPYSDKPRKIPISGRLHILLANSSFESLTGSEMYYYELAREYINMNHQVSIVADVIGNPLEGRIKKLGVDVITRDDLTSISPDVCIGSHEIMREVEQTFTCPLIQVIHSENDYLWEIEKPIAGMDHYIAIRETIKEKAIKEGVHPDKITTIWNPIDLSRFHPVATDLTTRKILFIGKKDKLRKKVIKDLYRIAKKKKLTVQLVGEGQENEATFNVEKYVNRCEMTASIYMGRTTLEGWACGKAGLIYEVDGEGEIISRKIVAPQPTEKYDSRKVAEKILTLI